MRVIVATAADAQKGYLCALSHQVHEAFVDFLYYDMKPFSWKKMIDWKLQVASHYKDDLVIFVDAWDMLFLGTKQELVDKLAGRPITHFTEKLCWPDPEKCGLYPGISSPWRYVNGTGPAGLGKDIAAAIEEGNAHFPIKEYEVPARLDAKQDNDQRFWTDVYLSGVGELDSNCHVHQSLVMGQTGDFRIKDGRLYNKVTGSAPCFVHANGASAMIGFRHLMDLLSPNCPYPTMPFTAALAKSIDEAK